MPEKITAIEQEMRRSYMDYAMSVIVGRSLPDVRDGLKPVQRRILYSMYELNLEHDKPYKKCARIVGEVMGKYHPHGDTAIYDSIVHMAQNFSLRYPLVDGQGNFGSIDGDSAAAMRYTEARLTKISGDMLDDIEKETVDKVLNFDGSLEEPLLLPSKVPNLLINGTSGIAVGMATKMPPHNISEILNAVIYYIENRDCDILQLLNFIEGPDFPTGGIIIGHSSMQQAYITGRGSFKIRSRYHTEKHEGHVDLVFTEIPYEVNKSELLKAIGALSKEGTLTGIIGLKDESNKEGIRIIIKVKKDANTDVILNQLFEHTPLEISYNVINLTLVDNVPKILNLKELISEFVKFRMNIIIKRSEFELRKAQEREHIVSGLIKALDHIDEIISLIRASKDTSVAKDNLMSKFGFTEIQAKAILDMRLQKLTGLERKNLDDEEKDLLKNIESLKEILNNEPLRYKIMKDEFLELIRKYGDSRKTEILKEEIERRETEDLIPSEDVVILVTSNGYIKRISMQEYRTQGRGGTGILTDSDETDFTKDLFIANTHDYLLFFTNLGRVYSIKTYMIPQTSRRAKGKAIVNFLPKLQDNEKVQATIRVSKFEGTYILIVTKKGIVKKTHIEEYKNIRVSGKIAITLKDSDEIVSIKLTNGESDIFIGSKEGKVIRFSEANIRPISRTGMGVRGIRLKKDDQVIGSCLGSEGTEIFTVTELGKGKRTKIDKFRKIKRAGAGVIGHKITNLTGAMVDILSVTEDDEVMIITRNGSTIQFKIKEVSLLGRQTMGVKLIDLKENDFVSAVTKLKTGQ
ncbi:MAG: DNA gyrase subunit A [Thermoplasmata archaeon]